MTQLSAENPVINKRSALTIATVSSFLGPFMGSSINIALPEIGHYFSMNAVTLGWVATSYLLTAAICLVPFGKISDIYGRKKIYTTGIIIYTLSSLFCAVSFSSASLIVSRAIQGIGSAMIFSTGMVILTSVFPPNERGKAFGISVASTYLGLSLGPFLGGIMTEHLGWRSIFWMNVPAGAFLILLVVLLLKGEWAEARGDKFDIRGSLILIFTLSSMMLGMSRLPGWEGTALMLLGISGLCVFVYLQLRTNFPLIDIHLFSRNRVFAFSNLAAFINYSATFAITFLLSLYLQYIKGFPPQYAGTILVSQPAVMSLFSPLAGKLSDNAEPRLVASAGMLLVAIGLFLLITVTGQTSVTTLIIYLMILGLGFALFSSPNTNAVMSSVEKKYYGIASSILGTMRLTGQMFSMGIAMLVFALLMGKVKIEPTVYHEFLKSMHIIFTVFTVLCLAGVIASFIRGKIR